MPYESGMPTSTITIYDADDRETTYRVEWHISQPAEPDTRWQPGCAEEREIDVASVDGHQIDLTGDLAERLGAVIKDLEIDE